jgi:hypothetical protein
MTKVSFFTGQPIFNQLLSLVPSFLVRDAAVTHHGDHYCKRFKTMDHLITMLYAIYNRCTSLREVTTGILAWEQRIHHIRLKHYPRRSTISDANTRRPAVVFESIYYGLVERYQHVLPDSRSAKQASRLYLFDSTTISLFHQILETSGRPSLSGKVKGGIKVHTLVRSDQDVPCLIRYSAATANDSQFCGRFSCQRVPSLYLIEDIKIIKPSTDSPQKVFIGSPGLGNARSSRSSNSRW